MKFIVDNWMVLAVALASGGMLLWPMISGASGAGLSASDAVQLINRHKAVVIDVSDAEEFAKSHVRGARNVPLAQLDAKLPSLVKNKALPVIMVCPNGGRAARAAAAAKKLGYEQAQPLAGGLKAWKEANLPIGSA
ncbi:MAG: rhodanese-like domain-containing protein [Burkholderiales bacterium]